MLSVVPRIAHSTLLIAVSGLLAACGPRPTPPWHQEANFRWRDLDVSGRTVGFTTLQGGRTGIRFENAVSDQSLLGNRVLGQGAGVALGDVDGDGLVDVFLARTEGCSALYRNLGDWRFEEVAKAAGVAACARHATGAAFADVDGDGTLDLVLLATTGPNVIFLNDGKGHFTERQDLGLDTTGRGGTTLTLADIDGSGRLAMFVANYKAYAVEDTIPPQDRLFDQMVRKVGPDRYEVVPNHRNDYKVVMRPDMGGLRLTQRAEPNELYLNDGHGRFSPVPLASARFRDVSGAPLREAPESFALTAKFADLNGDGAPDLYVANDFEDTDELWFNDGRGNFRRAGWASQRQLSNADMGVDVADINGDGKPDLFCVDMLANDSRRLKTQMPTHSPFPKKPGDLALQLQQQRNTLFLNRGDGTFAEIGQFAGVTASGWSWTTMFLDVDLDGRPDILAGSGHLWDIMDADVQERASKVRDDPEWRRLRWQFPPLKLRNVAWRNRGDLTFEDAGTAWRFGLEEGISHAMAAADLDGDGDLDVVVNRLGAPALVLRNDAPAKRVAIRLSADAPNTRAVGASLTLRAGSLPLQSREITAGGLYLSHSDYLASFAMGTADSAALDITWRDGRHTAMTVRANRLYEVTSATAGAAALATATAAERAAAAEVAPPLFEDASAQLGGHTHAENVFDDWGRQFLLPAGLSQLGPGVAWFDLDRDGDEDLIVGSGKGGRLAVFRNEKGRLAPVRSTLPVAQADLTGVLGLAGPTGVRLLAGISIWEARTDSEMVSQPSVVGYDVTRGVVAPRQIPLVGSHAAATGPIALGDYDGDGWPDLFVGSRAVPLAYPTAAASGLFRNVGGQFVLDAANSELLRNAGMVSAATFGDVNGDGHADLLLAREWDSILLLLNDGHGRFHAAPGSVGLSRWTGRWNGIAVGDLDADGRLDIVATNWGRNTNLQADSANPLILAHGRVGARGEEEMLLARVDPRLRALAPLDGFARVRLAIPEIASRLPTFAAFADATLDQVLGPNAVNITRISVTTLDHMLFLNRGDHFAAVPLPAEAQLAPSFHAGIADLDGDGFEDLFVGQNFSQTPVGVPRFDGGRGLLLLGNGQGALRPVDGARSGIVVYGDQRGAAFADYDGDGRLDLAVSQNGAATRLFRNAGARPGLRVRIAGPASNPDGLGVQLRVVYGDRMGPVREVQAGAGYWSQNGAIQVLGLSGVPTAVWASWPTGTVTKVTVPAGAREVTVRPAP